jgi:NitT/TauT family transport system permease protein
MKRPGRALRVAVPVATLVLLVALWEMIVWYWTIPPYVLPRPLVVAEALVDDWAILMPSLVNTLRLTFAALALAFFGSIILAILLVESRLAGLALAPYAVILQVTPIVALAPLLLIYTSTGTTLFTSAFLVAFFPILANVTTGLRSVDRNLRDLFRLHGAGRWRTLLLLRLPSSLPYAMAGLRIGGGLALIAAVVAEFAAGPAGAGSGLAFRVIEAQLRMDTPRLFAALVLLAATGVAIFALTSLVSWAALRRWHESALPDDD